VFLTLMLTAVRNHEIRNLRWAEVDLVECVLRVSDSKSEDGIRSIAMTSALVDALARPKERSPYDDDHEYVFADPCVAQGSTRRGSPASCGPRSPRLASPSRCGRSMTGGITRSRTRPPPGRTRSH